MDDDALHDRLTDIRGVGDATADQILDAISEADSGLLNEERELLAEANHHHDVGEHSYAAKYVARLHDRVDGER